MLVIKYIYQVFILKFVRSSIYINYIFSLFLLQEINQIVSLRKRFKNNRSFNYLCRYKKEKIKVSNE